MKEMNWSGCTSRNWMIFNSKLILYLMLFCCGCNNNKQGEGIENTILDERNMVRDPSMDSLISDGLPALNCLAKASIGKTLSLSGNFDPNDTTQILITPYLTLGEQYKSVAYTDLANRQILLQPNELRSFARAHIMNADSSFQNVMFMVILHELGHFKLRRSGQFDAPVKPDSKIGQMKLDTEPEYLTSIKRVELMADSIAVTMCNSAMTGKEPECFMAASGVLVMLPGLGFNLFSKQTLEDWGQGSLDINGNYQPKKPLLRDPNGTHPNLELRVAFMTYFLNPNDENKLIVDQLLYNREVAPVERQQFAPYIYQGMEKKL